MPKTQPRLCTRIGHIPALIAATIYCGGLVLLPAQAEIAPADQDGHRTIGITVGSPTTIPGNFGDTWAMAWGEDGNLYSPVNDGPGFMAGRDPFGIFTAGQIALIRNDPESSRKIFAIDHQDEAVKAFSITPEQIRQLHEWEDQIHRQATHVGFNRIVGNDPLTLVGANVNEMREFEAQDSIKQDPNAPHPFLVGADGRTWKSSGCSAIDGVLYLVIARHDYGDPFGQRHRQDAANASIIKSTDYGKTWTRPAKENLESPMFPGPHFATPYFIDYGKTRPGVDGADLYVYAISNNGFWDNGDSLILGRVLRAKIGELNGADWEFFTGGEGLSDANWTHEAAAARPILADPRKLGETGATYLPERHRYMMVTWYYPGGTGHGVGVSKKTVWNFYEALHPWGPWTRIGSHTWAPQGYYCPGICPKFQSAGKIFVMTAGDFENGLPYYHLTVVPVDLRN